MKAASITSVAEALKPVREVLVVEDELRVREMLSRALREMGYTATLAPTAEAGLKMLTEKSFDLLMLDLNLPGMDGMAFLEKVRRTNARIQVIIVTGFGTLEAARAAIHMDVADFITKPYTLSSLEHALDRAQKRLRAAISPMIEMPAEAFPDRAVEPEPTFVEPVDSANDLEEVERRQILRVLAKHKGNRANTAAELGISLRKLYYRLGQYQQQGLLTKEGEE